MAVPHLFGIQGLTLGGAGIWAIFAALVAWWIRGMADRRRARNEGVTVGSAANDALIKNLTEELARMGEKLKEQDKRITALETSNRDGLDREALLRAENLRLEAIMQAKGEIRQLASQIVAADHAYDKREMER